MPNTLPRSLGTAVALLGFGTASVAASAMVHAVRWEFLPAYAAWGCALVALAVCDAITQRIPTALVRQSTVAVCLLLICGGVISGDWRFVVGAAGWSIAAGAALLAAWRLAGAGAGDVRLAVLGGLGLTSTTVIGLLVGLCVWALVLLGQTIMSLQRGRSVGAHVALGPGLVAGFLVAGLLPE